MSKLKRHTERVSMKIFGHHRREKIVSNYDKNGKLIQRVKVSIYTPPQKKGKPD